jgi:hypothetical protein
LRISGILAKFLKFIFGHERVNWDYSDKTRVGFAVRKLAKSILLIITREPVLCARNCRLRIAKRIVEVRSPETSAAMLDREKRFVGHRRTRRAVRAKVHRLAHRLQFFTPRSQIRHLRRRRLVKDTSWSQYDDVRETIKVIGVKSQKLRNTVNHHRSNNARIVSIIPGNSIPQH